MGNQNRYSEEEQTTQWPKQKGQKDKQRSTKHESVRKREQIEKLQTIFKQLKLDDTRDNELEIEQVSVNDIFRTIPAAPNLPFRST